MFAFSSLVSPAWGQDDDLNLQKPKKFERTVTRTLSTRYLLFLPKGCDAKSPVRWPLMLFLHGAGERGTNLQNVAVHGPPKLVKRQPGLSLHRRVAAMSRRRDLVERSLLELLDEIIATHPVDTNRIYLTGLSMGGYGTWSLGLLAPEGFAAIAPVCGGGEPIRVLLASPAKTKSLRSMGVWAFHGAKDPVVKVEESQRMVDALKKAGVREVGELTVYPEADHDSWTATYNNEKLYEWFLKHRRTTAVESDEEAGARPSPVGRRTKADLTGGSTQIDADNFLVSFCRPICEICGWKPRFPSQPPQPEVAQGSGGGPGGDAQGLGGFHFQADGKLFVGRDDIHHRVVIDPGLIFSGVTRSRMANHLPLVKFKYLVVSFLEASAPSSWRARPPRHPSRPR